MLQDAQLKNTYALFNIEEEIKEILKNLNDESLEEDLVRLSYESLKIEQKANDTLPFAIKRTIKNDVVDYFDYIHKIFIEMDKVTPYKFDTLLCPVCGNKTRNQIREDTVLLNFPLYCPKCKQETLIEAKKLQVTVIEDIDKKRDDKER